jgi:hypothetical protein
MLTFYLAFHARCVQLIAEARIDGSYVAFPELCSCCACMTKQPRLRFLSGCPLQPRRRPQPLSYPLLSHQLCCRRTLDRGLPQVLIRLQPLCSRRALVRALMRHLHR